MPPVNKKAFCKVPECGNNLHYGNVTGLCIKHNHKRPYCKCKQCVRKYVSEGESKENFVVSRATRKPSMPVPPWEV